MRWSLAGAAIGLAVVALLPALAWAGGDASSVIGVTCNAGARPTVSDEWERYHEAAEMWIGDRSLVIGCPARPPAARSLQIAAGPERIGNDAYICTYLVIAEPSGRSDGEDLCWSGDQGGTAFSGKEAIDRLALVLPAQDGKRRMLLAVGAVGASPGGVRIDVGVAGKSGGPAYLMPVPADAAKTLGAGGPFQYFVGEVPLADACGGVVATTTPTSDTARFNARSSVLASGVELNRKTESPLGLPLRDLCARLEPFAEPGRNVAEASSAILKSVLA